MTDQTCPVCGASPPVVRDDDDMAHHSGIRSECLDRGIDAMARAHDDYYGPGQ